MPSIRTAVNRPAVPHQGATVTAEIDVDPGRQAARPRRHVALCVDASASMAGEEIERAIEGAAWVFGLLEPDDYVAIVAFDDEADLVLRPTRWGEVDRADATVAVEDLTASGGTDLAAGLASARDALHAMRYRDGDPDGDDVVRRLLVLSDGRDADLDTENVADLATEIDAAGVRIQAAGLGTAYDEETVRTLGTTGRGEWTHLDASGDVEAFFGDAVEAAASVVAPDARLELDPATDVTVSDVYRALPQAQAVEPDPTADGALVVPLPDLVERETQRVVLKLQAPAREVAGGRRESLVDVVLSAGGETVADDIAVTYTDDADALARNQRSVQLDYQETVVRTALGRGDVEAAETAVERMTRIHGPDAEPVREAERQTRIVAEGGRAERNRATRVHTGEGIRQ